MRKKERERERRLEETTCNLYLRDELAAGTLRTLETYGGCYRIGCLRAPYRAAHMRAGALYVLQHSSEATDYHRRCATLSLRAFLPSGDSGGCNPSSLHLHSIREPSPIGPPCPRRVLALSFVLLLLSVVSSSLVLLVPLIR